MTDSIVPTSGGVSTVLVPLALQHAAIFDRNAGSQAVARKAGYELEGRMPFSAIKAGRVIGRVLYARYRAA